MKNLLDKIIELFDCKNDKKLHCSTLGSINKNIQNGFIILKRNQIDSIAQQG
jgi:hypothetical protein